MKKLSLVQQLDAMIPLIWQMFKDSHHGLNHVLIVCKRLKTEVARRVLHGYKRLVKDRNIDNQGFMEFDTVAPIGEVWI